MNKFKSILMGTAALLAFTACSSDDPTPGNNPKPNPGESEEGAYLTVTITSSDVLSKSTEDGGFEQSIAGEHEVTDARFYFFDKDGVYMKLTCRMTNPAIIEGNVDSTPSIEFKAEKNILVLEGLEGKDYPSYMLTVLNAPDFTPGETLASTQTLLSDYYNKLTGSAGSKRYFVMTSTSFFNGGTNPAVPYHKDWADEGETIPAYFTTALSASDFKTNAQDAVDETNPILVYVERLAAKVQLNIVMEKTVIAGKDGNFYKLPTQSISGKPNDNNEGVGEGGVTANTEVYFKAIGWYLNNTANRSKISKEIDAAWTGSGSSLWNPNGGWNDAANRRSYWGKSIAYGQNATAGDGEQELKRISNDVFKAGGDYKQVGPAEAIYCNENTNTADFALSNTGTEADPRYTVNTENVTYAVLYGQICDSEGNPLSLIKAGGTFYTTDGYMGYILNRVNQSSNKINIYTYETRTTSESDGTSVEKTDYYQIGGEYFDYVIDSSKGTGLTHIELKKEGEKTKLEADAAKAENPVKFFYKDGETWYEYDGTHKVGDADVDNLKLADAVAKLATDLQSAQPSSNYASMYENGKCIYNIPVEHLGATPANEGKKTEGYYGVVRNHWYTINVSSFSRIGFGMWDPDNGHTETINPPSSGNTLYYLGAHINILSWKLVNQTTPL